jgi:hypothetical protein
MTIAGNFSQMSAFVGGLDSFPRLFTIQTFTLSIGAVSTSGGTAAASTSVGPSPLWVGGITTAPTAGPYLLTIAGSIYYTTTPSALDACTKATASAP